MSFEIMVSAFRNEGSFYFPVAELSRRFSTHAEVDHDGTWKLRFEEGPCLARVYVEEGESVRGFTVGRPPDYLAFWDIIGGILRDLPCALYWPSTKYRACMGSLDLRPHLPPDFVKTFGIPFVCTDGAKIRQYVHENS